VCCLVVCFFFFQAEDGIRDFHVTGVQTCALPILRNALQVGIGFFSKMRNAFRRMSSIHSGSFFLAEMSRTTSSDSPRRAEAPARSEERRVGKGGRAGGATGREQKRAWPDGLQ